MDPYSTTLGPVVALITRAFVLGGFAAACAALAKIICTLIDRHKSRKVTIEMGDRKIIVEGYPIEEARSLIENLLSKAIDKGEICSMCSMKLKLNLQDNCEFSSLSLP